MLQKLPPPYSLSSSLSHAYAPPILLPPNSFSLSTYFCCLPFSSLWRMNELVSGAILCPSSRNGVCATSHWSSKWAGNGAGGPACQGGNAWHWADQLGTMDQTATRETRLTSNTVKTHRYQKRSYTVNIAFISSCRVILAVFPVVC